MKKKDSYANFTVYESDKDCKTSDSISISASDGKLSVCHYIWDEGGTPYGDKIWKYTCMWMKTIPRR
jgi:hypothetical protein